MKNILKSEFYQVKKDKRYLFILIASIVISSVLLLDSNIRSGSEALYQSLYNMSLIFIAANIFIALYIGGNFSDRQINRYIASGHKRKDIVFAQSFVSIMYSNLILILQPIIVTVFFSATKGWGNLFLLTQGIIIIITSILLNSAFLSILTFVALLLKKTGSILITTTALYFLNIFLLNSQKALSFAHILPLGQARLLIENESSNTEALLISIAYIFIFNILAKVYFNKCDLK
jgi:ABC-2 type transport system permease protein